MNRVIFSKVVQGPLRQSGTYGLKQTEHSKDRLRIAIRSKLLFEKLTCYILEFVRFNSTVSEKVPQTAKKIVTYTHPTVPLSSFNKALVKQLQTRGPANRVLNNVLKIIEDIKKQNLRMNASTYSALLTAYSRVRDHSAMTNVLEEMKENGIHPDVDSYTIVLEVKKKKKTKFFSKNME